MTEGLWLASSLILPKYKDWTNKTPVINVETSKITLIINQAHKVISVNDNILHKCKVNKTPSLMDDNKQRMNNAKKTLKEFSNGLTETETMELLANETIEENG